MDVINKNNQEVAFKEFKCAYEIINKIKKGNLTVENAEMIIKAFEICHQFVLKAMEIKIGKEGTVLSLPKYLLVMAAKYKLINDLEMWLIFYDAKGRFIEKEDNTYKGKLACSVMRVLPIFKIKVDEIMKSFEVKNKAID